MSRKPGTVIHHGQEINDEQCAALMADALGWNPDDGDELRGTVLGAKIGFSDVADRDYPIVFILLDEGKELVDPDGTPHDVMAVHCFQASLVQEMRSQRPMRGDRIYVKRIGERGEPKRRGFNAPIIFAVAVTKPGGQPRDIWGQFTTSNVRDEQQRPKPDGNRSRDPEFSEELPF